ncbi:MAG: hypothetical protein EXR71_12670 [Myxococcales bacterium]|nr:hypothetical protein [Myxococcales bacterium]
MAYLGPGRMEQLDAGFLAEIQAQIAAHPTEPWPAFTRALLLHRLGRAAEATVARLRAASTPAPR